MSKIGDRVGAVCSSNQEGLEIFGEGEYMGQLIPGSGEFGSLGIPNPCIKLDNGTYVWGYQSWWGPIDKMKKQFGEDTWANAKVVTTSNYPPKDA